MLQSVFFCVYFILSIYIIAAQYVEDTPCGSATLRGPMREDGVVVPVLRVEASLYSEDPIVIRCQLNRTENPNMHYNLRLKIDYIGLEPEMPPDWLTDQSLFSTWSEGNVIYYNVSISASAMLERSIISCGADYQPAHGMRHQHCYTKSIAVIIFRDYDPCDHPTATLAATPKTPSTNSSTSELETTKRATASPITTPITPSTNSPTSKLVTTNRPTATPATTSTNSTTSESPTTKWDPNSIPNPNKIPAIQTETDVNNAHNIITMNKREFFLVVGIAILVGITLLVANGVQLWVIIIMRNRRRANLKVQISATNDAALERDTEMDCGLESEEDTTIQNNVATDSG